MINSDKSLSSYYQTWNSIINKLVVVWKMTIKFGTPPLINSGFMNLGKTRKKKAAKPEVITLGW